MTHDETQNTAAINAAEHAENSPDQHEPVLSALLLLLSDVCFTRFDLLMTTDQDPLEAAEEVIESLDRYDFLADLMIPKNSYQALKKQVESRVSDRAEEVIVERNPR